MKLWNDERLESVVGLVLRMGVTLAASVVLIGGSAWLAGHGHAPNRDKFAGQPQFVHFSDIMHGVRTLQPLDIIELGLLLLIATPVVRVIVCAAGFALERDWTYAVVSTIVLALLLFSLAGSGL